MIYKHKIPNLQIFGVFFNCRLHKMPRENISIKRKIILTIGYIAVVVPISLVGLLAVVYYYFGIEKLFSEKIADSINDTVKIAELYLEEHNNNIKTSALLVIGEIAPNIYSLIQNTEKFNLFLDQTARSFDLSEIIVFTRQKVLGKTSLTYSVLFENIPNEILDQVDSGLIVVKTSKPDKVQALLRIDLFMGHLFIEEIYLMVGRYVDSSIMEHLQKTQAHADVFSNMRSEIKNIRKKVISVFILMSLSFLLLSIFVAKKLAIFILKPISDLSEAITSLKLGQSIVKVHEKTADDEINILAKSFNKMVDTISIQHEDIIYAKNLIEERNHFIEAIMTELSAGVLVLDKNCKIEMSNIAVLRILQISDTDKLLYRNYLDILPELSELVEKVLAGCNTTANLLSSHDEDNNIMSSHINITRAEKKINLLAKVQLFRMHGIASFDYTKSHNAHIDDRIIITIDDITAVVSGQRFKAWADIARRLAHEIKNPLTPIQLAVDRLEQKFFKQIKDDKDNFQKYITTIGNRVDEIRKMLTDFVEFAGMSAPKLQTHNIIEIVNEVLFLQQHVWPKIDYQLSSALEDYCVYCDKMHITQVLINLLKNSAESINILLISKTNKDNKNYQGLIKIKLELSQNSKEIIISIQDNGLGVSNEIIERICEPYVTTKSNGTGLGLSIVKKIIEAHKGEFNIKNLNKSGAIASFNLKLAKTYKDDK
jgi:two-component system nitrogen regulation sensor histidine kinase NtrY